MFFQNYASPPKIISILKTHGSNIRMIISFRTFKVFFFFSNIKLEYKIVSNEISTEFLLFNGLNFDLVFKSYNRKTHNLVTI